jgi:FkbM family methyltransferase
LGLRMDTNRLRTQLRTGVESVAGRLGLYRWARRTYRQCFHREAARHDRTGRDFYRQLIRPGDLVFDVGANTGERTAVFLDLGARVVAVEPNPSCADVIRRRYACRSLAIEPSAVGAAVGSARLHVAKRDELSSVLDQWVPDEMIQEVVEVPLTTVDALVAGHGVPAFVKIDVEGYEEAVLAGMQHPVPQFSFEFHSGAVPAAKRCIEFVARPHTRFNLSWGEAMSFALADWVDAESLLGEFDRIELAHRGAVQHGDVYVRDGASPAVTRGGE